MPDEVMPAGAGPGRPGSPAAPGEPPNSISVRGEGSGSTQKTYLRRAPPGEAPRRRPGPGGG